MNRQRIGGREITVVVAAETRKRPDDMRRRTRLRGPSRYDDRHSSRHGRSRSRSRSPDYRSSRRQTSRSYSPAPRRQGDRSASPPIRRSGHTRSPRDHPEEREKEYNRKSYSPTSSGADRNQTDNGYERKGPYDDDEGRRSDGRSPRRASDSPSGSRSRSADSSAGRR